MIAVIAILASLLMPALQGARQRAQRVACANNLRQVGLSNQMYLGDTDGWLPGYYRGGNRTWPSASPLATKAPNKCDAIPQYWFSLWPDHVRWCPSISSYCEDPVPAGAPSKDPLHRHDYNMAWGYMSPMMIGDFVGRCMRGRTANFYTHVLSGLYDYVMPLRHGLAKYVNQDAYWGFYGKVFDTYGTQPITSDVIRRSNTDTFSVAAHTSGHPKKDYWQPPRGSNSLWQDGHVEWHDWKAPICGNYKNVATKHSIKEPAHTAFYPSIKYYYWAKPSTRITSPP